MASQLEERYDERIAGVLSCYDRVVVTGALRSVCYAEGTRFLFANAIRIFDSPEFASKLRDRVRQRAASLAAEAGIEIEQIAKNHIRKEIVVARVLKARLSGLARQDATHKNFVRPDSGKCLHYYFYRHRSRSGLSARAHLGAVPPAILLKRPQLAGATTDGRGHRFHHGRQRLRAHRRFFARAGTRDGFSPDRLHAVLDRYAVMCCPVLDVFGQTYHWSLMPVEYSTDLTFRSRATLGPLYEQLIRESVLSVKAEQIATFLGRQITPQLAQELGSQFSTRIEGTCIKHRFGQRLDQNVGQVRLRVAYRNHDQRRVLLQAPPQGGTS
jgi:hypothetical protein